MAKKESTQVLAQLQKDFGAGIGGAGMKLDDVERIPTGIFQLDLNLGGGFAQGRVNVLYGPESCGKTTVAMLLAANTQSLLNRTAVVIDIEGTFDPVWASRCGVKVKEMVRLVPDTAEQAVDMIEAMLYAQDVGLVVVDSIAALTTSNEIESDATKVIVAGSAMITTKMVKKSVSALNSERKRGHTPALVCINQTRYKIGTMYGDPETTPGGNALRFASSLTVRLHGKDKYDKAIHDTLPVFKETTATTRKWKVPVVGRTCEYEMCLHSHGHLQVGQSNAWNTVSNYLKQFGLLGKDGKEWVCMGHKYPNLAHIQKLYESDGAIRAVLQKEVVHRLSKMDMGGLKIDAETGEILDG